MSKPQPITIEYIKGPTAPTWIVVLNGEHAYEMSENADQPNGVCIYTGEWQSDELANLRLHGIRYDGEIPKGMTRQIAYLIAQMAEERGRQEMLKAARAAVEYVGSANYAHRERAAMTYISAAARGDTSKTIDQIADEQDQ